MTDRRAFLLGAASAALLRPAPAAAKTAAPSGYILMDMGSGAILDAARPDDAFIPASLTKIPTALHALDAFGATARFATRLLADGPITGGVLQGDLLFIGGGDPSFDVTDLAGMARAMRAQGLREVRGRFLHHPYALPETEMINPRQPWQAPYNPGLAGLNLNYNRVRLLWDPGGGGPDVRGQAIGDGISAPAPSVKIDVMRGDGFGHALREDGETWRVGRAMLTGRGRRWLPVRRPAEYTASVLRALARREGVMLPPPQRGQSAPGGRSLVIHRSAATGPLLKGMLRYSNNLTAEALGAAAARRRGVHPRTLEQAGMLTKHWLAQVAAPGPAGWNGLALANHSGLTSESRATPMQMAAMLRYGQSRFGPEFSDLFVEKSADGPPNRIRAKTGTMHFVRGLAGYLDLGERRFAFAIMADDPLRRAALDAAFMPFSEGTPPGAKRWLGQARSREHALIGGWIRRYS